jgi:hypothetical protein
MTTRALRRIDTLTAQLSALSAERGLAISRALAAGATWAEIAQSPRHQCPGRPPALPLAPPQRQDWSRLARTTAAALRASNHCIHGLHNDPPDRAYWAPAGTNRCRLHQSAAVSTKPRAVHLVKGDGPHLGGGQVHEARRSQLGQQLGGFLLTQRIGRSRPGPGRATLLRLTPPIMSGPAFARTPARRRSRPTA